MNTTLYAYVPDWGEIEEYAEEGHFSQTPEELACSMLRLFDWELEYDDKGREVACGREFPITVVILGHDKTEVGEVRVQRLKNGELKAGKIKMKKARVAQ